MGYLFNSEKLLSRFLALTCASVLVCLSCYAFGTLYGQKTVQIIEKMIRDGKVKASYWRVLSIDDEYITVGKFNRSIVIVTKPIDDLRTGDNISFIAVRHEINTSPSEVWIPTAFHRHGSSAFKFYISLIALTITLIMGYKSILFDRHSTSLYYIN